ncbi:hypothetical protein FOZ61_000499 [Perkinsus olseni]|uniref:Rhodanese domain-containing protein n=2 Tax=Perkinsus olseni TaxID=32597 RepID=A0A7J6KUT9_PEROL|nr:hypothetical protein FOZ61_000499 [Perkinsus olseni]
MRGLQYNGALMLSSASGDNKRSNTRDGFIKDIYIVYADDVNNPPHYLRQRQQYSNEEGVHMIGHSNIMDNRTYPGVIPSNNRVAIRLSTANIPNISNWYLAMDDDIFLASKLKLDYLFDAAAAEASSSSSHSGKPPHIGYMEAPPRKCPKSVTNGGHKKKKMSRYEASSCNGDRIIREYFGIHKTMGETDHIPVWVNKCIYNAGSRVFNDTGEAWRGSMTSVINPTNVQWNSFNNNLLYYLGLLRLKATTPSKFKYEIHSNTPSLCQHTAPTDDYDGYARAMILGDPNKAQSLLDDMLFTSSSQWVNIQGPGYSDEYDPCPQFRRMVFNNLLKVDISKERLVVYTHPGSCAGPRVWWMFTLYGLDAVYLQGGLIAWEAADGDVEWGVAPEPRPGLRRGHIPGSINIPFTSVLQPDDPTSFNMDKILNDDNNTKVSSLLREDKKLKIFTCGSGVSAAVVLLADRIANNTRSLKGTKL